MNTESLSKIVEIISNLGEQGTYAFIWYLSIDFAKTLLGYVTVIICLLGVAGRLRRAVEAARDVSE